jgi:hypothetical protein
MREAISSRVERKKDACLRLPTLAEPCTQERREGEVAARVCGTF